MIKFVFGNTFSQIGKGDLGLSVFIVQKETVQSVLV